MQPRDCIVEILGSRINNTPGHSASGFAASNIALCKYWGKRDTVLNLPQTSSLSISLGSKGACTRITCTKDKADLITLNNKIVDPTSNFYQRIVVFLDLFRGAKDLKFNIDTMSNLPIAAGVASSACGFAAIVLALNKLYNWQLKETELSILSRLGSGSAARSLWHGFVYWQAGSCSRGLDSYAKPLNIDWPEFCVGLQLISDQPKAISSREAMARCVVSQAYRKWPEQVANAIAITQQALAVKDFLTLGMIAEENAEQMHAIMLAAKPQINYSLPATEIIKNKIRKLRKEGLSVYFTQDAGPNLKLLFLRKDLTVIKEEFPSLDVVFPFLERAVA